MFENIGIKIMSLAKVLAWIGIIFSVIIGVSTVDVNFIIGLAIIAGGSLLSWVSSFILYGFGQLIDDVSIMKQKALEKDRFVYKNNDNDRSI